MEMETFFQVNVSATVLNRYLRSSNTYIVTTKFNSENDKTYQIHENIKYIKKNKLILSKNV